MENQVEMLSALLRGLPVLPERDRYIPKAVALLLHNDRYALKPEDYRPRGDKAAIKELGELAELMKSALSKLDKLSDNARAALFEVPPGLSHDGYAYLVPERALRGLEEIALRAKASLDGKGAKEPARRPPNTHAATISAIAVGVYEVLTGKKATVITSGYTHGKSGPFLEFLQALFALLGTDASATSQAETAISKRDERAIDIIAILDRI